MSAIAAFDHTHHRRYRRAHWFRRLVARMYALGVVAGYGTSLSADCDWCVHGIRWAGHRPYILGVKTDHWACILRRHHWPADPIGFGLCSKCLPCPSCGSKTAGHEPGCEATR